jgi:hypothetical protein
MFVLMAESVAGISFAEDKGRFVFSDLTVKNKKTGLVWARDANLAGDKLTWFKAQDFVEELNLKRYGGYSDWRLPTKKELEALKDYAERTTYNHEYLNKTLNKIGFKNVMDEYYWSSTSIVNYTGSPTSEAWVVSMGRGDVWARDKSFYIRVWPVRRGK